MYNTGGDGGNGLSAGWNAVIGNCWLSCLFVLNWNRNRSVHWFDLQDQKFH